MEPEYTGFCRVCNGFSEHLKIRSVKNNNTGTLEVSMFCPECRRRFGISFKTIDEMIKEVHENGIMDYDAWIKWVAGGKKKGAKKNAKPKRSGSGARVAKE